MKSWTFLTAQMPRQTRSTLKQIEVEICAACHPFFTGQQKLVDSAGRVERFMKKYGREYGPSASGTKAEEKPAADAKVEQQPEAEPKVEDKPAAAPKADEKPAVEAGAADKAEGDASEEAKTAE